MPFDQSRTIVHTVTVGSVSFAQPGAKAMHNAATAQEVQIISPSATNFQFRVNIGLLLSVSFRLTIPGVEMERPVANASMSRPR